VTLARVEGRFAVCRLPPDAPLPAWATGGGAFVSITRTADELSIVCEEEAVPDGVYCVRDFAALRVVGKIDFGTIGVLATLTRALADAGVSVIAVSTFDTDYVLLPSADLGRAVHALSKIATIA
jgi:hypothetical protein